MEDPASPHPQHQIAARARGAAARLRALRSEIESASAEIGEGDLADAGEVVGGMAAACAERLLEESERAALGGQAGIRVSREDIFRALVARWPERPRNPGPARHNAMALLEGWDGDAVIGWAREAIGPDLPAAALRQCLDRLGPALRRAEFGPSHLVVRHANLFTAPEYGGGWRASYQERSWSDLGDLVGLVAHAAGAGPLRSWELPAPFLPRDRRDVDGRDLFRRHEIGVPGIESVRPYADGRLRLDLAGPAMAGLRRIVAEAGVRAVDFAEMAPAERSAPAEEPEPEPGPPANWRDGVGADG